MFGLLWPIGVAIFGATMIQLCAKETPEEIHPFASLAVTYFSAMVLALVLFFLLGGQTGLVEELQKTNWTSWGLGLAILFMDLAYILLYRAGWKISVASLVANIASAVVLLVIGMFLYRESLSPRQLLGAAICAAGLLLVNWPGKADGKEE